MSHPALVVSLHDVSPLTHERCARIMNELDALGVKGVSLLVIPDHHGRGHFLKDPRFCDWLRDQARCGHEIVTHGYFHRRNRQEKEGLVQQLTTRVYTADEGEFYDLDRQAAKDLVQRANRELRQIGLDPRGFIAPAWLLSEGGETALRELGCEYTTRLRTVSDLRANAVYTSQSLCWSVRSWWRREVSKLWNALLFRRMANAKLLRIAIHPVDLEHVSIWGQIRSLVSSALSSRMPMTYLDWVTRQRATR